MPHGAHMKAGMRGGSTSTAAAATAAAALCASSWCTLRPPPFGDPMRNIGSSSIWMSSSPSSSQLIWFWYLSAVDGRILLISLASGCNAGSAASIVFSRSFGIMSMATSLLLTPKSCGDIELSRVDEALWIDGDMVGVFNGAGVLQSPRDCEWYVHTEYGEPMGWWFLGKSILLSTLSARPLLPSTSLLWPCSSKQLDRWSWSVIGRVNRG